MTRSAAPAAIYLETFSRYSLHKQLHILLCDDQLAGGGGWVSAPAPLLATLAETLTCNKTQHATVCLDVTSDELQAKSLVRNN
jgi:hypothetical protein